MTPNCFSPRRALSLGLTLVAVGLAGCGGGATMSVLTEAQRGRGLNLPPPPPLSSDTQYFENKVSVATFLAVRPVHIPRDRRNQEIKTAANVMVISAEDEFAYPMGYERRRDGPVTERVPPVFLSVAFENTTDQEISFEVLEVNSALGNFAAQPDRLTLAPGERGELQPMISRLGLQPEELQLTLSLRMDGQTERQQIRLVTMPGPPIELPPSAN